jgi:predicted ATPase/DNA-binding CsgD family transcriptional regulator
MTVGNLPAESNTFVGRERDLVDLVGILARARTLTLCGPGGIGKTRLATRLGASLVDGYPDGAWVADLVEAETAARLVPVVCAALGVQPEVDRSMTDTLTEALRPRTMLLILDTCEHLVAESAELVEWLVGHCPGLRVIATSAEPLRARGEVIWRVPPLALPSLPTASQDTDRLVAEAAGSDAVQLFVARAAAARPGFELGPAHAAAIVEICRTLDGVPLAIELAAARLRSLSVEQILTRLVGRFELLAVGDRTAPRRQQTLRATVEWSYDLLAAPERVLLSRLSVFHGWNLEMAEQVCGDGQIPQADVLDLLTALIDKSLVSVDYELDGDVRYRLLDTVRQFAAQQADAAEMLAMRQAHRDCMLALAETMVDSAVLRDDVSWSQRVRTYRRATVDMTNFHLALEYCADHDDAEQGLRLCNAIRIVWLVTGDLSGSAWLDRFIASKSAVSPGVRSRALVVRSEIAFEQQDYRSAGDYAAAALDLSFAAPDGNPAGSRRMLALAALASGHRDDAVDYADAAIAAAGQMRNSWEAGVALGVKAAVLAGQGEQAGAVSAYTDALVTLNDSRGWAVAGIHYGLGRLARTTGDKAGAERHFSAALALYREVGARTEMARCLAGIGQLALERDDLETARACLTECSELSLLTGQRPAIARSLAILATFAAAAGEITVAVRLVGAARELFHALGTPDQAAARRLGDVVDKASAALGSDAVASLLAEGTQLSPHQAARQVSARLTPELVGPDGDEDTDLAVSLAAAAGAQPAPWPGQLTEREQQVALLVARGYSNKAIGAELTIVQATAARHVANIYLKLGFTSRAELIGWVLDPGQPSLGARPGHLHTAGRPYIRHGPVYIA